MITKPDTLDLTPYRYTAKDRGAFISKTIGWQMQLEAFSAQMNIMCDSISQNLTQALQSVSPLANASEPVKVSQPVIAPALRVVISEGDEAQIGARDGAVSIESGQSKRLRFCGLNESDIVELSVRINGQYASLLHTANIAAKYKELQREFIRDDDFTSGAGDKNLLDVQKPLTARMPAAPAVGTPCTFILFKGSYSAHPLTLDGNGEAFAAGITELIVTSDRSALTFRFNGDFWRMG